MENIARCLIIVFCFSIFAIISGGIAETTAYAPSAEDVRISNNFSGESTIEDFKTLSLLDFKASYNGSFTLLEWRTDNDNLIDRYTVEVSYDEENYEAVAEVKNFKSIQNFKNFNFIDNNNLLQDSFYRLKHVDAEGAISYSTVVMVKVNPLNQLRLFPVPTKNVLNIKGYFGHASDLDIKITDLNGNGYKVYNLIKITEDHYTIDFSSLNPNTYFVKISCNGKSASYRVLKL